MQSCCIYFIILQYIIFISIINFIVNIIIIITIIIISSSVTSRSLGRYVDISLRSLSKVGPKPKVVRVAEYYVWDYFGDRGGVIDAKQAYFTT